MGLERRRLERAEYIGLGIIKASEDWKGLERERPRTEYIERAEEGTGVN